MIEYKIFTTFGTFHLMADKWSLSKDGLTVYFWQGKKISASFLVAELNTPDNPNNSITTVIP